MHSSHTVKAVYTQPDRPSGRGRQLTESAIKLAAKRHQLPIYQPLNFKHPETLAELNALNPDVMVVIAYGLLLPPAVLAIPRLGCINVHASLLPRWRGASPIQQAILHDDKKTGITLMQMDQGMDTGAMLQQVSCDITPNETTISLQHKLAQLAPIYLLNTLNDLAAGRATPKAQEDFDVTYAPKIKKEDARINWQQPAQQIDCLIRAFNPWPVAFSSHNDTVIRIHQARIQPLPSSAPPGTILDMNNQGLLIATGTSGLWLERIQFPGGNILSLTDLANNKPLPLKINDVLS